MTNPIRTERHDDVLVIISDNPPVNALGAAVRQGLEAAIKEGVADATIAAMVIRCDGRTFFAGADITEFGKPMQEPSLPTVVDMIEASSKPVVAAIHGTRARRRLRGDARLPLPRRRAVREDRHPRGEARPLAGRRRDAAYPAHRRGAAGAGDDREGRSNLRQEGARRRADRQDRRRGHAGRGRGGLCARDGGASPPAPRLREDCDRRSRRGCRVQEGEWPPLPWLRRPRLRTSPASRRHPTGRASPTVSRSSARNSCS